MIVSSRTPDIDDFCAMCLPNVMIVRYDFDGSQDDWMKSVASSWDDWVKRVVDAGEAVADDHHETFGKFITVALANHGPPGDRWDILATVGLDVPSGTPDAGLEDMLELMASLASSRVDLLACGLAATEAGVRFVEKMETRLGVNFAASDDVTGNPAAGGDWILETDNVNVKKLYFDSDKMAAFEGSFLLKKKQHDDEEALLAVGATIHSEVDADVDAAEAARLLALVEADEVWAGIEADAAADDLCDGIDTEVAQEAAAAAALAARKAAEAAALAALRRQPRLMLVSSRTPDIDDFCAMCLPSVTVVRYDFYGTKDEWMKAVADAQETVHASRAADDKSDKFVTVALANHGPVFCDDGAGRWDILATVGLEVRSGKSNPGLSSMLELMAGRASERVDLLASGLAATTDGVRFVDETEIRLGVKFAASSNVTGNPAAGGDWILETGDVDVGSLYFDPDKLADFHSTFILNKQQQLRAIKAHGQFLMGEFGDALDEIRRLESGIRKAHRRNKWEAREAKEGHVTKHRYQMASNGPVTGMEALRREAVMVRSTQSSDVKPL
jgi:hypothetical protein